MPVQTACTFCSAKVKIKDELLGKSIKCPKCGKVFKSAPAEAKETAVKTTTKTAAAPPPVPKKAAPWANDEEDEEKSAPWDKRKSKNGKADDKKTSAKKGAKSRDEDEEDEEDTPKSRKKTKAKGKKKADDDEDTQSLREMLAQTQLPDSTKKLIEGEMGLRERAVWVGQPCPKIMTVRAIPKCFMAVFVITILSIMLGATAGVAGDIRNIFFYIGYILLVLLAMGFFCILIPIMDRRKALGSAYVITNKRCIVFNAGWFMQPGPESYYPDILVHMRRMGSWVFGSDTGDLVFRSVTTITTTHHARGGTSTSVSTTYYGFLGIRQLDETEQIIRKTLLSDDDDDDDDD